MFDQEHPLELVGTVTEFRYSSPHIYIFLDVKGEDGANKVWLLEGGSPSLLLRDGWTGSTIRPVSSRASRTAASRTISPTSRTPPGIDHCP